MTEILLKLMRDKGQMKIDASDVVKVHDDGSVTIKIRNDERLVKGILEFTDSDDPKVAKEARKFLASYALCYPKKKLK